MSELLFNIDEAYFKENAFKISGWIYYGDKNITHAGVFKKDSTEIPCTFNINVTSPDVEAEFGIFARDSRFSILIPVDSFSSIKNIIPSSILFKFSDSREFTINIFTEKTVELMKPLLGIEKLKVGLGITTYNRKELLKENIRKVQENSFFDLEYFVSDDGSSDGTNIILQEIPGINWLSSNNKGISWNKNRAIFFLKEIKKCDIIILIEDDVYPEKKWWDIDWVLSTFAFGHINYAPAWFPGANDANQSWFEPTSSDIVSGQCCGFSSEALGYVGYLDTRFGSYGHEHVEHTLRMIRAGYGGIEKDQSPSQTTKFFMIHGGMAVAEAQSSGTPENVHDNSVIFDAIWNESIFRPAWRTDDEMKLLRSEMKNVVFNKNQDD